MCSSTSRLTAWSGDTGDKSRFCGSGMIPKFSHSSLPMLPRRRNYSDALEENTRWKARKEKSRWRWELLHSRIAMHSK
jgi:hypothetical protein